MYEKEVNFVNKPFLISKLVSVFVTTVLVFLSTYTQAQINDIWIDLAENENYVPRHECSFVQAGDKFILFGGRESSKRLDMYDFATDKWQQGGQAPLEFNHFQATFYKGFVWVIGAFNSNNFPKEQPESHIWLYYPPTQAWIKGPEIPESRRRGGAGLVVFQDKFYLLGGNTIGHDGGYVNWFDEYDPYQNKWKVLENAPHARDHFHAAILDGKLYAAGGRLSGGKSGVFAPLVKEVDTFDFALNKWSSLKNDLPTPRAAPGIAVFNGELLVMGGEGERQKPAFKKVEAYNPKTQKWTQKADMNYARHGTQTIVSGEGIYILAGSPVRGGGRQKNMEVYNKDAPSGEALKNVSLVSPKTINIDVNRIGKIEAKVVNGNTSVFIENIYISGKDKAQFKLSSQSASQLVDVSASVLIEHIGDKRGDTATVNIIYNGGQLVSTVVVAMVQ
jgi:N-acetylneuraminic acid mutarotase